METERWLQSLVGMTSLEKLQINHAAMVKLATSPQPSNIQLKKRWQVFFVYKILKNLLSQNKKVDENFQPRFFSIS